MEMEKALGESAVNTNKHNRLVDWMTELLLECIKKVVTRHNATGAKREYPLTGVFLAKGGGDYKYQQDCGSHQASQIQC
jgi:hypothetical protein